MTTRTKTLLSKAFSDAAANLAHAELYADDEQLEALGYLHEATAALQLATAEVVGRARRAGCSWEDIGQALGTSRQAAHQRFSA